MFLLYLGWWVLLTAAGWKTGQTLAAWGGKRWPLLAGALFTGFAVYAFAAAGRSFVSRIAVDNDGYLLGLLLLAAALTVLAICPDYCGPKWHTAGKLRLTLVYGLFWCFCVLLSAGAAGMLAPGSGNRPDLRTVAVGQGIAVLALAIIFSCKNERIADMLRPVRRAADYLLLGGGGITLLLAFLVPALIQMKETVFEPFAIPSPGGLAITVAGIIGCLLGGYIWRQANYPRR